MTNRENNHDSWRHRQDILRMKEEEEDMEPMAGLSCASSCISLSLFGTEFRPVFTHQSFEGEYIRGYTPLQEAADQAALLVAPFRRSNEVKTNEGEEKGHSKGKVVRFWDENDDDSEEETVPHSSYWQNPKASFCLSMNVTLSPSCCFCALSIYLERKKDRRKKSPRNASKNISYVDNDFDDYSDSSSDENCDSMKDSSFSMNGKRKTVDEDNHDKNIDDDSRKKRIRRVNTTENYKEDDSVSLGSNDTENSEDDDDENDSYQFDEEDIEDDEDYCGEDGEDQAEEQEGKTRTRRMEIEEIVQRVSRALPSIQYFRESIFNEKKTKERKSNDKYITNPKRKMSMDDIQNHFLDSTLGDELCLYTRNIQPEIKNNDENSKLKRVTIAEEQQFVLCFACGKDPSIAAYHKQIQKLALWFIETAEDVDVTSDEGGGFWKILYLFQKHKIEDQESKEGKGFRYSLVGFVTLFFFFSPFKKPSPGLVMRVCQIIILPPYQRKGHGKKMLSTIYDIAKRKYDAVISSSKGDDSLYKIQDGIAEINVESPAPSFKALRNRLDFELLKDNVNDGGNDKNNQESVLKQPKLWLPEKYFNDNTFETLQESDAVEAAAKAKITPIQMHISYELLKLDSLHARIKREKVSDTTAEMLIKKYRLMVKKRLNVTNREILGRIHTKTEKQKELASIFDTTFERYKVILRITKI